MFRILRSLAIALIASTSVLAWAGYIHGRVRFNNGQPADHVILRLRGEAISYQAETQTDTQGKFAFDDLPLSTFALTIEGQGFRPYASHIDISMSKMAIEDITLRLDKEPQSNAEPPPGTAVVISAQEAAMPEPAHIEYVKGRELLLQSKAAHESIGHFLKAIKLHPSNPDVYILLAMAYMQDNNPEEALSSLKKNIEANPQSADAHFTFGTLLNQAKDYATAEKVLLRGLEINSEIPQGHYELAKTYWALGKWQQAELRARKAVELQPDMPSPHVILGNIEFLHKHDAQAALREFHEYLRLAPDGPMAEGTKQMIYKIEESLKSSK